MPTDLPARVVSQSRAVETAKDLQALFLFYFGMATVALLLVASERYFGMFDDQTIAQSILQTFAASPFIDQTGAILLPTGP